MEQRASDDVPVKVVHKAKETIKLVSFNQAAADVVAQFKRLVLDCYPDLVVPEGLIQLEYKDSDGDHVLVEDDRSLRFAISEFIAIGQAPKFIVSCKAQGGGSSVGHGQESDVVRPPQRMLHLKPGDVSPWESGRSWVDEKVNRLKLGMKDVPTRSSMATNWRQLGGTVPCKYYQAGRCGNGAGCGYLHASAAADFGGQEPGLLGATKPVLTGQGLRADTDSCLPPEMHTSTDVRLPEEGTSRTSDGFRLDNMGANEQDGRATHTPAEDGVGSQPCRFQLPCGHASPRQCHPGNHDGVDCLEICSKRCDTCEYPCTQKCHFGSACPPCLIPVRRELPGCGHKNWWTVAS